MLEQPTISTARDLENMIDSYRGQIGIQEQSIAQNKKFLANQEYTIGQNDLRIKELDSFINDKETKDSLLTKEVSNLEDEKATLSAKVNELNASIGSINAEIALKRLENTNREDLLNTKENELNQRELSLTNLAKGLEAEQEVIDGKHAKIKEFVSKI